MGKKIARSISCVLVLVMVLVFLPTQAFAAKNNSHNGKTTYTVGKVTYDRPIPGVTRDTKTGQISVNGQKTTTTVTKTSGSSSGKSSGSSSGSSSGKSSGSSSRSTTTTTTTMYADGSSSTTKKTTETTTGSGGSTKTEKTSSTTNYDTSGNVSSTSNSRSSVVSYADGTTYEDKYEVSKSYNAKGKEVTVDITSVFDQQTNNNKTGAQDGASFALSYTKNADGTSEESTSKVNYYSASDITSFITSVTQTRANGKSVTSEFKDHYDGDVLGMVSKRGTEDDNWDLIGTLELENEMGRSASQIRNVFGLDDQYLPFGTSTEAFEGQKTTYYEFDKKTGELTLRTSYIDQNGDVLCYEMVYNADGTLKTQRITAGEVEGKNTEVIFDTEKWIAGEMEASEYESKLGNWGIDFGKVTTTPATAAAYGSTRSVTDDSTAPEPNPDPGSGGDGYSTAYSVTANVKSPAGKVYVSTEPANAATYGNSKTWTYSGSSVKTISIVPDEGYVIKDVQINGVSQGAASLIAVSSSASGTLVNVWFERETHTITATYGNYGIVSPSGVVSVYEGESQTFTFTPDKNCSVAFVVVDGKMVEIEGNTYTFDNVTEDHTIHVEFSNSDVSHFRFIYATAGDGGSLSLEGCIPVTPGTSQDIEIIPDKGYEIDKVIIDGEVKEGITHFRFESVQTNHTMTVTFKKAAARSSYVVTATAGQGGKISPSGMTTVASGGSITFKITPDTGYVVGNVYVNGQSAGMMGELTLTNIFDDQTVNATFINTSYTSADLSVMDITPTKVYAGMKAMTFVRVVNLGTVAASNTEVKLNVNGQTYTQTVTESIYPGSYRDVLFTWPAPAAAASHTAEAKVNENGVVTETNVGNNSLSKTITVAAMFPEAGDGEDPGVINPAAHDVPGDNPIADITWEQNGELYRAVASLAVAPSAEGLKSGYGFEMEATIKMVTNSPDLSLDDIKVIARLPEFAYAKCKTLEEDLSKRTETTQDGARIITRVYRFQVNTTSKVGARRWYVPVTWPDMYNYKLHTQVIGIATPTGYIELSQNSSILINSNMYTDDSLHRG